MNRDERRDLVLENLPLVGYLLAGRCAKASHLSREDPAAVGAVALGASSHSFDPESGVPFGAFARRRIPGAMADDMRASDWATRRARTRIKTTLRFQEILAGDLGRQSTVDELAAAWGVNRAEAMRLLGDGLTTYDGPSATELAKAHSRISAPRLNSCLTNVTGLTAGGRTRNATALPYQAEV